MDIRPLIATDATEYQALRLRGLREWPSAFASSVDEEIATPIAEIANRLQPQNDGAIFGAFVDVALVGVVGLQRETMRKLAHKAYVWGMYVAPDARKLGVGKALLQHTLNHARDVMHVRQVNLGVNASNQAAIALYKSLGFESFGIERDFMLLDGVLHDEIHMVRVLRP
jgi:ribosomal protein S18 acetylase RimI-like enzyme